MIVTRRKLFGLFLLPAFPRMSFASTGRRASRAATPSAPMSHEWEVLGFSLYSGPDMLDLLQPGIELRVAVRGQATGWLTGMVFARETQIGYLETTPHDTVVRPMPTQLIVARIERSVNGRSRMWAHVR